MTEQFAQFQNMPQEHKQGGGCINILTTGTWIGFYSYYLYQANMLAYDCCAVTQSGSNVMFAANCSNLDLIPDVATSTNVSSEFRMLCIWAISIFSIMLGGSLGLGHKSTEAIAGCLGCLGCCGFMAWFITANVFVFREEGLTCGLVDTVAIGSYEDQWVAMYNFQWRAIIAMYGLLGGVCLISCFAMCCLGSKLKNMSQSMNAQLVIAADEQRQLNEDTPADDNNYD